MKTTFKNTRETDHPPVEGDIFQYSEVVDMHGAQVAPVFMVMDDGDLVCLRGGTGLSGTPHATGNHYKAGPEEGPFLIYSGELVLRPR